MARIVLAGLAAVAVCAAGCASPVHTGSSRNLDTVSPRSCSAVRPSWVQPGAHGAVSSSAPAQLAGWRDATTLVIQLCGRQVDLRHLPRVSGPGLPPQQPAGVTLAGGASADQTNSVLVYPLTDDYPLQSTVFEVGRHGRVSFRRQSRPTWCDEPPSLPPDVAFVRCGSLLQLAWRVVSPFHADLEHVYVDARVLTGPDPLSQAPPEVFVIDSSMHRGVLRVVLGLTLNEWALRRCMRLQLTDFDTGATAPDPELVSWASRAISGQFCVRSETR